MRSQEAEPTAGTGIPRLPTDAYRHPADANLWEVVVVTRFERVDGRQDLWEARIVPDETADVTLVLDSPVDCDASDAVCTKADSPLTTRLALSVPGPGS